MISSSFDAIQILRGQITMSRMTRRDFTKLVTSVAAIGLFASKGSAEIVLPAITAYRNPGCGCCEKWADSLKRAGFVITMDDDPALATRKVKAGVPSVLSGCHTAFMGNYVIEGHVPVADIRRLLEEQPAALGLAVPGMPAESTGMEMGGAPEKYDVMLFAIDGTSHVYTSY
jgi:hypothetical protein